jgi:hypothetical protein
MSGKEEKKSAGERFKLSLRSDCYASIKRLGYLKKKLTKLKHHFSEKNFIW